MKNSASGIITAFLAGAAVGALIGILFAPDKGSVTRERLRKAGEELGGDLAGSWDTIREEFAGEEKTPGKKTGRTSRGRKRSTKNTGV